MTKIRSLPTPTQGAVGALLVLGALAGPAWATAPCENRG